MGPHHRTWPVAGLLFASGFCALVYQIGWLREFRLIFGASTAASAAVLAIFIGGLGFGGWLLGRRADAHTRPLMLYAQLEGVVALSAAASPVLLSLVRQLYVVVGGTPRLGVAGGTIVRLLLSALVLAVPTIAMGGTLPAAARAITGPSDQRRRQLALLYGCNTMGAVTGCLVATFLALELFGTRATLWLAAAVNLIVAVTARQVDRSISPPHGATYDPQVQEDAHRQDASAPLGFVLTASGIVGFAFFLMELVWYRMLGPLLGGSVFTFGLILAIALAGIGLGGLIYALFGADRPADIRAFVFTCLLEAVAIAFGFALGDRLAMLAVVLTPFSRIGFWAQVGGWTAITTIVVFPAALVAGYQFPLLVALLGRGRAALGRQLGLTYGANTIGAIIGSLVGGFGLLPWLSAPGAWRFVAIVLLLLGFAASAIRASETSARTFITQFTLIVLVVALLKTTGPTSAWRHTPIGAGRVSIANFTGPNKWEEWRRERRRAIVWEGDGVESSVALSTDEGGYGFVVNGKSDGSAISDSGTQVMLGMLGPILNPAAKRMLVIGLGTGSSAGWPAAIPSMERVDVVELEPIVVEVAKACAAVNHDVLNNPKVRLTIGDAREWLLLTPERYDIIASEPSNPFRAGVASLFTREYYRAADDRLSPDGLFLQWVQSYEIDAKTLQTIYATMGSVFPYIETWQTTAGDTVLVAAKHPIPRQSGVLARVITQEPFKSALRSTWHTTTLMGVFSHYVAGNTLSRAIAATPGVEYNADDRNVVEFGFARTVGRTGTPLVMELRNIARQLGDDAPLLDGRRLDPSVLRTGLVSFYNAIGFGNQILPDGSPAERARQRALEAFYVQRNGAAVRSNWEEAKAESPRDPVELAMLATMDAAGGLDSALPYIDQIRGYSPAEADILTATLLARQGKPDDAATALESAFRRMTIDPWPLQAMKDRSLGLAQQLGTQSPALARRMIVALQEPFAVGAMPEGRKETRVMLTRVAGLADTCAGPMHDLEPYFPWEVELLTLRRDCYAVTRDPLLDTAERDLRTLLALDPQPIVVTRPH